MSTIEHGSPYTTLASAEMGRRKIRRLGGATLQPGTAVGAWAHFATVEMTALVDLPYGPKLSVQSSLDGVAGFGRGTIPRDHIRIVGPCEAAKTIGKRQCLNALHCRRLNSCNSQT
ncbi:MAG: hypothetical protein KAV82_11425 [Phycisphaerae bacterium]|nr:hypothetical protein [Phycisphaerae bacterium]